MRHMKSGSGESWLGLEGTRVLVAGAGGLGASCVTAYLEVGAHVVVVDVRKDRLVALEASVENPERLSVIEGDLTESGVAEQVVQEAASRLGGLDVLLHSVGINDRRPVVEFTQAEFDRIMSVNLGSAFALGQAAGRMMVEQGSGRILMISSVAGLLAHANHAPYATSKGGMNQLMRSMAREWAPHGVRVNAIAPGYVETDLTAQHLATPGVRQELTDLVPAGRLGTADEVVGPALFLSSRHAEFVTGHVMYVDGGRTLV